MWSRMKRTRVVWAIFCFVSREYQPPFGSIGHAIQSGRLTEDEATSYLDRIA